jgi:hypothetical protein
VANNPGLTKEDWDQGLNEFIQANTYVDPEVASAVYQKVIPKPTEDDFQ